jgi:predicted DNA-binding transcriptional regulator YafY
MNQSAALRRHLHLIRLLDRPYSYPSKAKLLDKLNALDLGTVSERTLERDLKTLRNEYFLEPAYDPRRRGYYLHFAPDEDLCDFHAFVRLLERRERLEFLTLSIGSQHSASRYLELEDNQHFAGLGLLSDLWNALLASRVVEFTYQPYSGSESRRKVEPGLIFEYRNRFYLAAHCTSARGLRTFGLDRIRELIVTAQVFSADRRAECRTYRAHVIGVTAPADQPIEQVVLRFTASEGNYVKSLPMHPSQHIVEDTNEHLVIALDVVVNHELQREILAYGPQVEVLEPTTLRQQIVTCLQQMQARYQTTPKQG